MKILAINPGSTSTKIAVYDNDQPLLVRTIRHSVEELSKFAQVTDQFEFRKQLVLDELASNQIPFRFDAIIGRGGLLKPIPAGVYEVNEVMRRDASHAMRLHACNLGCLIAYELAAMLPACRSFIADPGVVDELDEVARITGSPQMPRITIWHALNQRAIARRFAAEQTALCPDKPVRYEELDLLICHLGGGISTAVHQKGRAIDVNNALDGEGPFSPERSGNLPMGDLIDCCFSGQYSISEVKKLIYGKGGLIAHLGTNNLLEIESRIAGGDAHAARVLEAMIYQVAKSIGAAAVVLYGKIDAILLTGGIAHSSYVIERLQRRISFLAPVYVYPGEDELEALALNALGALRGELEIRTYR
ncbi:MAG: butyrate kinase [Prevotellaceae bacterium]|jgi:butyrate kinase|nr:butyrate kinase [Prevotellaceae bacterium]